VLSDRPVDDSDMAAGGGDFVLGAEYSAIEEQVKRAMGSDPAAASGPDHCHYPYARQVRTGWHQDAGKWAYDGVDDHLWEVFCQQCGGHRWTGGESGTAGPPASRPLPSQARRRARCQQALQGAQSRLTTFYEACYSYAPGSWCFRWAAYGGHHQGGRSRIVSIDPGTVQVLKDIAGVRPPSG
jgi:hypothetical protein